MGYISKLTCQCGYTVTLDLGTGMRLPDASYIKENFSPGKLKEFNAALNAGCLGKLFYIENTLSFCRHCNALKEGRALHFQVNGKDKIVYDLCPDCSHELEQIEGDPVCPQCGKVLNMETAGLWD